MSQNPMLPIVQTAEDLLSLLENIDDYNVYPWEILDTPHKSIEHAQNLLRNLLNQYKKDITS